ncbi:hypothetical protein, partial [Methylobacterium sp. R2-1]|uniref:hypothetical protein n=1 Tax=Methylobacterium sp. R2-1 TaxID=2587064 RepID=UPI001AED5E98
GSPAAPATPAPVPAQGPAAAPVEVAPAPAAPAKPSKDVAKVMLYLHPKVARKFKEIAFTEDRKAHDVYLDALDAFLTQQGHGGLKGVVER